MTNSKMTPELRNEARLLYRRGEPYSVIARALKVTPDTARRWIDPEYNHRRKTRAAATPAWRNQHISPDLPTLAYVSGLPVTGKYRMRTA